MLVIKLSGEWLWPPEREVDALVEANARENAVEAVMRIRALVEISRNLDTAELAELALRSGSRDESVTGCVCGAERALVKD